MTCTVAMTSRRIRTSRLKMHRTLFRRYLGKRMSRGI